MRKHVATIFAFLIAPLFAAIALVSIGAVKNRPDHVDMSALVGTVIFYCYTLGATLIIGLPVYLLLRKFNKVTWWSALLTGVISGAVMAFILLNALNLMIIVVGGLSGLVFWLIWRRGKSNVLGLN